MVQRAESEYYVEHRLRGAVHGGETTCYSQEDYFNYDPEAEATAPRRSSKTTSRGARERGHRNRRDSTPPWVEDAFGADGPDFDGGFAGESA